ncbi:MAG TPA: tetratricopeptide repeat protein, partial [Pyrinomonadaceae bacterium]|nr:tetratricopeptide repeat protein [Pyrinomonadaceae bacterium]
MKGISLSGGAHGAARLGLVFCLFAASCVAARAQAAAEQPAAGNANAAQARLERARTLAAVGNLQAAAAELEAMRGEPADDSARYVARILLMSIYVMQGGYSRADGLLQESFDARTAGGENSTRLYFALAGQLINGVRLRLDRYRDFGLNYTSLDLPPEARADVDQMRSLLERV